MCVKIVEKALHTLGSSIKDRPYAGTITLSEALWTQYVDEVKAWAKSTNTKLPDYVLNGTKGTWSNHDKSVTFVLQKGETTSVDFERAMIVSIHKQAQKNEEQLKALPERPAGTRQVYEYPSAPVTYAREY